MSFSYIQYEYPVPHMFQKILFWVNDYASRTAINAYFALKLNEDDDWNYFAAVDAVEDGALNTGYTLVDYGTDGSSAEANCVRFLNYQYNLDTNGKFMAVLPSVFEARFVRMYVEDGYNVTINEFRPSTYVTAHEIISGTLELSDQLSDAPKILVRAGEHDRVKVGELYTVESTDHYGVIGFNDASATIFELSSSRNFIGGWTIGASTLTGGKIQSNNLTATDGTLINLASEYAKFGGTNVAGATPTSGIFIGRTLAGKYAIAAGYPATHLYFDGENVNLSNAILRSSNWTTNAGGELHLSSEWLRFGGSDVATSRAQAGVFIGKNSSSGKYVMSMGNPATYFYYDGDDINLCNVGIQTSDWDSGYGAKLDLTNQTLKFGGWDLVSKDQADSRGWVAPGIFLGRDSDDNKFKLFVGNTATYIDYDGENLSFKNVVMQSYNWTTTSGGELDLSNEWIRFGGSDVATSRMQAGVFIGKNSGTGQYVLSVGATGNYIYYDGVDFNLVGCYLTTEKNTWQSTTGGKIDLVNEWIKFGGSNVTAGGAAKGVFLGKDSGAYKFFIGAPATYLKYDGDKQLLMQDIVARSGNWTTNAGGQLDLTNEYIQFGGSNGGVTSAGVRIGKDGGVYKARIGKAATYLYFDGDSLELQNVDLQSANFDANNGGYIDLSSEYIQFGGYNGGISKAGVYLGKSGANYVAYIGDGINKYVAYDGANLVVSATESGCGIYLKSGANLTINSRYFVDTEFKGTYSGAIVFNGNSSTRYEIYPSGSSHYGHHKLAFVGAGAGHDIGFSQISYFDVNAATIVLTPSSGNIVAEGAVVANSVKTTSIISSSGDVAIAPNSRQVSVTGTLASTKVSCTTGVITTLTAPTINTSSGGMTLSPSSRLVTVNGTLASTKVKTSRLIDDGTIYIIPTGNLLQVTSQQMTTQPSSGDVSNVANSPSGNSYFICQQGGASKSWISYVSGDSYVGYTNSLQFYKSGTGVRAYFDSTGNLWINGKLTENGCLEEEAINNRWNLLASSIDSFNKHSMKDLPVSLKSKTEFKNDKYEKVDDFGYRPSDMIHLLMNCVKDLKDNIASLQEDIKQLKGRL